MRFDLTRLGNVRGLRGVHPQCHIGTDTVSLSSSPRLRLARLLPRGAGGGPVEDVVTLRCMRLVDEYLAAIEAADAGRILALFADGATVDSPLYGQVLASEFYPRLFDDTARSQLRLRSVMVGETIENRPTVAFWFDFDWTLSDGTRAPFTVVDVAELDHDGRIRTLHILYDTAPLRASFDALPG
jgi:hypothetical protein